ncbi:MAG: hypothetical protein FWG81_08225 [Betaproteobacteria bacterium]|nr:hypothetical protein [Betaproteobacteria bacterium]
MKFIINSKSLKRTAAEALIIPCISAPLLIFFYKFNVQYSVFIALIFFTSLFSLTYFRQRGRLQIDDYGIRFDHAPHSYPSYPSGSWHIAWQDIQLPIILNFKTLYIQQRRSDDNQQQRRGRPFARPKGDKTPDNSVFIFDTLTFDEWQWAWDKNDSGSEKIINEIQRRLGQDAIKLQLSAPCVRSLDPAMLIGTLAFLIFSWLTYAFWVHDIYSLNPPTLFYISIIIMSISLPPIRHRNNSWLFSFTVALLLGIAAQWSLCNGLELEVAYLGQYETRTFVLREPSPYQRANKQVWLSDEQCDAEQLRWETRTNQEHQPYQPGDKIELPVRRGLFGQYVLKPGKANEQLKKRHD